MGYGNSVQFVGKTAVLNAFRNSDASNWSILQGNQFMFKYEGTSTSDAYTQLSALLDMIGESSGSEARYTLRTYDWGDETPKKTKKGEKPGPVKEPKKRKIYQSTEYDGCFNFTLFGNGNMSNREISYQRDQEMKAELTALREQVKELLAERDQEPAESASGIAGTINALMDVPEVKAVIVGKVIQLFNGVSNKIGSYLGNTDQVAKIAGPIPAPAVAPAEPVNQEPIQLPQEQVTKLNTALTALVRHDASFPDHLYKLALIAQKSPETYKNLVVMLNNMTV